MSIWTRLFSSAPTSSATENAGVQASRRTSISERSGPVEADNLGTRQDTERLATAFWFARLQSRQQHPFVLYRLTSSQVARAALEDLPCIRVATDTGNLICTEVLAFGHYDVEGGTEAVLCGNMTRELWSVASATFQKHGGMLINEVAPETSDAKPAVAAVPEPEKVRFLRSVTNAPFTYHRYSAPDAASAKAFLASQSPPPALTYIVIETPEGEFGRDIKGMYEN